MKEFKKINSHWVFILIFSLFGLMFLGSYLGELLTMPLLAVVKDEGWVFTIQLYFSFIGTLIITLAYLYFFHKDLLKDLLPAKSGGMKGNNIFNFVIGILLGFFLMIICGMVAIMHQDIFLSYHNVSIVYLLVSFIAVLIQSSTEEIIARRYIMGGIEKKYGVFWGILANSLFFAFVHMFESATIISTIAIFVIAIGFSLFVHYYKSMWLVFGFHTMWNFTQGFILGIPVSGNAASRSIFMIESASNSLFYDINFGLEAGITALILNVLIVLFILYQKKWKKAS